MAGRKPTRTVFVGNIGPDVTEHMLTEIFAPIGSLKSVRVVLEKDTGVSKGYAFCAYFDLANAESAYRNLNGRELNGRPMRLGYAEDYAFRHEDGSGPGAGRGRPPAPVHIAAPRPQGPPMHMQPQQPVTPS
ncbi:hypothetical protein WJX73_008589 [Symbiochloris irregularis]|uniref:RRM domain-containing protein n=1 Tax=Symbiochloris irregularis TaxID=706552 RepID=A0AAW1NQ07_9CHLO